MHSNTIGAACKRILDIAGASIALAVAWPVMAAVAITIRLTMGCPILFRQVRPGQHECPFTLFKFRTMIEAPSSVIDPSTDAARLTRVGSVLRRFSLDELPQLWNVLKGEMSFVGPRPLLTEYLAHYTAEQAKQTSYEARDYRAGSSQGAQCHLMGTEISLGRLVCRALEPLARPSHTAVYDSKGDQAGRNHPAGAGDDGEVWS